MKRLLAVRTSSFAVVILITFIVMSCGGGGGGGGGGGTEIWVPYIYAQLYSLPTGSSLPGYKSASVYVLEKVGNDYYAITDAMVYFFGSGVTSGYGLTYNSNGHYYEGDIVVAPGGDVTLGVTVYDGTKWPTYVSRAIQLSSYPIITEPVSGASWSAGLSHTIKWSGNYPTTNTFIGLGIADPNDINGDLLWPSDGYLLELGSTETSYTIPANSLTPGNGIAVVIVGTEFPVVYEAPGEPSHGAGPGSVFVIGGFNYVPITVIP
jgi:hypothetical protein